MSFINDKVILTYALDSEEVNILNNHFEKEGAKPCIIIKSSMGSKTLSEILEGKITSEEQNQINEKELFCESEKSCSKDLPLEKAIILNGFEGEKLQKTVINIREILQSRPILAVVTPISINMKFGEILEHLIEEREFHKKNAMQKK
ncbi:DUF3783 domain-containing protein [Clostridium sp.]|uniref:DUF3783 domain-containing protein n=1 Tax=Clostridium sp. TaxID=1506 RepID=UPI002FC80E07